MSVKEYYFYAKRAYPVSIEEAIKRFIKRSKEEFSLNNGVVYLYNEKPSKTNLSYLFPSLETHVNEHIILADPSKGTLVDRACLPMTIFNLVDVDLTVVCHRRVYFSRKIKREPISSNNAACTQ